MKIQFQAAKILVAVILTIGASNAMCGCTTAQELPALSTDANTTADSEAEWDRLNSLVLAAHKEKRYQEGIHLGEQGLAFATTAFGADHEDTYVAANNLALNLDGAGEIAGAEKHYLNAYEGFKRIHGIDHETPQIVGRNLAKFYRLQERYGDAEPFYRQSLEWRRKHLGPDDIKRFESAKLLANLYRDMGRFKDAEVLYIEASSGFEKILGPGHSSTLDLLNSQSALYHAQGRFSEAIPLYQRILSGQSSVTLFSLTVSQNLATAYSNDKQYDEAEQILLSLMEDYVRYLGDEHPLSISIMSNLAALYYDMDRYEEAEIYRVQTLVLSENHQDITHIERATILTNYAYLLDAGFKARPAAIHFQKEGLNILQNLRANLSDLDNASQNAFLDQFRHHYDTLQQWLVEAGRFAEAEQVGRMLKEQEYFEFTRKRAIGNNPRESRISLSTNEAEWQAQILSLSARPNALAVERNALLALDERSEVQDQQLAAVDTAYNVARRDYRAALINWRKEVAAIDSADVRAEAEIINQALRRERRDEVAASGERVALLQIVPLRDQLHFFLVTPEAFVHESLTTSRADLFATIGKARELITLGDPSRAGGPVTTGGDGDNDALQPLLHELHDKLIAPIEHHLDDAGAETLVLNLQGALRYTPVAALYDEDADKPYLAERYRLVLYTANGLPSGGAVSRMTSARGFGVSTAHEGFNALPAVRAEMDAIFNWQDDIGVFDTEPVIDESFTRDVFRASLADAPGIVHIASHFSLQPGDTDNSFLLLGDGNHLSLSDISLDFEFDGVDLLTLSACSTGLGGDGSEVDSFGALAQDLGADAVVATLWNVADDATADLMASFYKRLAEEDLSRAEALRQAQIDLIQSADRSHPYYWAPFILMGDWR